MFFEIPQNLILMTVGAFLLGWLLSSISGSMSSRFKARKRDPRDDRIRSLEADHRVAQSQVESLTAKVAELEKDLEDANDDSPAYLIHDYACEEFDSWLEANYIVLFENLLNEWYTDPALWPQERTLKLLKTWCDLEVHSMVLDCVDEPLEDDGY